MADYVPRTIKFCINLDRFGNEYWCYALIHNRRVTLDTRKWMREHGCRMWPDLKAESGRQNQPDPARKGTVIPLKPEIKS